MTFTEGHSRPKATLQKLVGDLNTLNLNFFSSSDLLPGLPDSKPNPSNRVMGAP